MWGQNMMNSHAHGAGLWWGATATIFWMVIIALVILATVVLLKRSQLVHSTNERDGDAAMAILRARYARGEINGEQFDQMRRKLEGRDDASSPT